MGTLKKPPEKKSSQQVDDIFRKKKLSAEISMARTKKNKKPKK